MEYKDNAKDITKLLQLLVNNEVEKAKELANDITDDFDTVQGLIKDYETKQGMWE